MPSSDVGVSLKAHNWLAANLRRQLREKKKAEKHDERVEQVGCFKGLMREFGRRQEEMTECFEKLNAKMKEVDEIICTLCSDILKMKSVNLVRSDDDKGKKGGGVIPVSQPPSGDETTTSVKGFDEKSGDQICDEQGDKRKFEVEVMNLVRSAEVTVGSPQKKKKGGGVVIPVSQPPESGEEEMMAESPNKRMKGAGVEETSSKEALQQMLSMMMSLNGKLDEVKGGQNQMQDNMQKIKRRPR